MCEVRYKVKILDAEALTRLFDNCNYYSQYHGIIVVKDRIEYRDFYDGLLQSFKEGILRVVECMTKEEPLMIEFENGSTIRVITQSVIKRGLSCNTLLYSESLSDYHPDDTNMIIELPYKVFEAKMCSAPAAEENTDCCEPSKELENFLNEFKVVSKNVAAQQ